MSVEKYIEGKHDENSHHDGRYANVRHIAETDEEVIEFWEVVWPELPEVVKTEGLEEDEERPVT